MGTRVVLCSGIRPKSLDRVLLFHDIQMSKEQAYSATLTLTSTTQVIAGSQEAAARDGLDAIRPLSVVNIL